MQFRTVLLLISGLPLLGQSEGPLRLPAAAGRLTANPQSESIIEQVRRRAMEFNERLPNFLCQQSIRRYEGTARRWTLLDTVSFDVTYANGAEQYRNFRRNGKPVRYSETQKRGISSDGEYGTMLRNLMAPGAATFRFRAHDSLAGAVTEVWDYEVSQPASRWSLVFNGRRTRPAYRGAIWIDAASLVVRRIEMEAVNLPGTYPLDRAEMTLDYGPVSIAGESFTLPVRTENLACWRDLGGVCTRNETEFRAYRRFGAEITIRAANP
ncbi:MAG: hypothetical protein JNK87_31395 [Bryobacterales bacterium]|nr:hypothetical protein [Bryobacterales bacterium]